MERSGPTVEINGETLAFEVEFAPFETADGRFVVVTQRDTNEFRELDLGQAYQRYRDMVEQASEMFMEFDEKGQVLFVSPNCLSIVGYPPETLLGWRADLIHPDDLKSILQARERMFREGETGVTTYRFRHAEGHWVWLEASGRSYRAPDGSLRATSICRDVSERIVASRRLEESERRYRILADNAFSLVIEVAEDGRTTFVSRKLAELIGKQEEELLGPIPPNVVHPEDLTLAKRMFHRILEGGSVEPYVVRLSGGDGSWWDAELLGSKLMVNDGERRILFFGRDVTLELQNQEARRKLEDRAILADRVESVALLASGVAHDFNDLLSISMGVADLIKNEFPVDSPYRQHVEEIIQATQSAAALSRQLLAFAGGSDPNRFETVDLVDTTTHLEPLIRVGLPPGMRLWVELPPGPIWLDADPTQIGQVLLNLVRNAREASDGLCEVTIRARMVADESQPEDRVFLEVEDTGPGIHPDNLDRIFDPHFTTKQPGRGLGLAVVQEIVSRHGGSIEVESKRGAGTRFRIELPLVEGPGHDILGAQGAAGAERRAEHQRLVLIVDDHPAFRKIVSQMLAQAGFQSLEADRAERALEVVEEEAALECVLLDIVLPGMDGVELGRRMRVLRPHLPIVWISGAPDRVPEGSSSTIAKPFRQEALIAVVRGAIETEATTRTQGET